MSSFCGIMATGRLVIHSCVRRRALGTADEVVLIVLLNGCKPFRFLVSKFDSMALPRSGDCHAKYIIRPLGSSFRTWLALNDVLGGNGYLLKAIHFASQFY